VNKDQHLKKTKEVMITLKNTIKNEQGFVLIVSLLMLVVLMIIGIAATNTTVVELQISGNDKLAKQTFYQADSGTQVGIGLLEEVIDKRGWPFDASTTHTMGLVTITNKNLFLSQIDAVANGFYPDAAHRDAMFSFGRGTTGLLFDVNTTLSSGGALQMIAGYEGKGKGSANSGAWAVYDIRSQHDGPNSSQARVFVQWIRLL